MAGKYIEKRVSFMVSFTLCKYLSRFIIEKGKDVHGTIPYVLKLLKAFSHFICPEVGEQPLEYLDSRAFIKEIEIFRRIVIEFNQVLHFREKVRVRYVQKIP